MLHVIASLEDFIVVLPKAYKPVCFVCVVSETAEGNSGHLRVKQSSCTVRQKGNPPPPSILRFLPSLLARVMSLSVFL